MLSWSSFFFFSFLPDCHHIGALKFFFFFWLYHFTKRNDRPIFFDSMMMIMMMITKLLYMRFFFSLLLLLLLLFCCFDRKILFLSVDSFFLSILLPLLLPLLDSVVKFYYIEFWVYGLWCVCDTQYTVDFSSENNKEKKWKKNERSMSQQFQLRIFFFPNIFLYFYHFFFWWLTWNPKFSRFSLLFLLLFQPKPTQQKHKQKIYIPYIFCIVFLFSYFYLFISFFVVVVVIIIISEFVHFIHSFGSLIIVRSMHTHTMTRWSFYSFSRIVF